MNEAFYTISTFSILPAAVFSWIRLKKLDPAYLPFILLVNVALLTECTSRFMKSMETNNSLALNIYSLFEILLITWQFRNWKLFYRKNRLFWLIMAGFVLLWISQCFTISIVYDYAVYFIITTAFAIVLMTISMINRLLVKDTRLSTNATFQICIGFVVYYTYVILVETFQLYSGYQNVSFDDNIFVIHIYVNCIANFIFSFAVLWIPRKPVFLLPS